MGILLFLIISFDLLAYCMGQPIVPVFVVQIYKTCCFLPGLFIAVLLFAPIFEEALFRGFMFKGFLAHIGSSKTIFLTALFWSLIHIQYNLFGIFIVFVVGILLGVVRLRSNSILPTILLHSLMNLVALIEVAIATSVSLI